MDKLDQELHNSGFSKTERYELLKKIFNKYSKYKKYDLKYYENLCKDNKIIEKILKIIEENDNDELIQEFFMRFGNTILKKNLDQFYTPITISKFISNIVKNGKKIIEPACGTGDMTICMEGDISLWDISSEACDLAELNYKIRNKTPSILNIDTLKNYNKDDNKYTYCVTNPPFGTKTITKKAEILNNYALGKDRKSQQLGILFIERAMRLLEEDGILFIILPSGYMGNSHDKYLRDYLYKKYRILSLLQLPKNTFKRSGTGVETYIMIVQKTKMEVDYDILIEQINDIGYILNKKNTPIKYLINKVTGKIITKNLKNVVANDLIKLGKKMKKFAFDNKIKNLIQEDTEDNYEFVNTKDLIKNNFDIKKYISKYTNIIKSIKLNKNIRFRDLCIEKSTSFKKNLDKKYRYIAISNIQTPLYKPKELYGWELPSRAKQTVNKYDILISRLEGNISFTIILDEITEDIIITNGVCILRPKTKKEAIQIFSQLFTNEFKIQHQSLVVGSIMQSLTDKEVNDIIIPKKYDKPKFSKMIKSLETLITLL
jgi:type I restriction enzyme M protein